MKGPSLLGRASSVVLRFAMDEGVRPVMIACVWALLVLCVGAAESPTTALGLPTSLPAEQSPTVEGKITMAEAALKNGDFAQAVAAATAAIRQASLEGKDRTVVENIVRFVLRVADQAKDAGRLGIANHCYSQIKSMYPPSVLWEPQFGLAEVARLSNRPWEAYELYADYLKLPNRPRDHRGDLGMGLTCLMNNQHNQAIHFLRTAVRLAPNNPEAHMGLARALHGVHKNPEALAEARRGVQLDDALPPEKRVREYRFWLAIILKDAQQLDEAAVTARQLTDSIRAAIKADPTNMDLVEQLQKALILRYQILEAQAKTDQGSKDPKVFLERAQVVEEQGVIAQLKNYYRALDEVIAALRLQPENVASLLQAGRLYRMVGNTDEAISAYQQILKVSPGQTEAKEALRAMNAPLAPTSEPTSRPPVEIKPQ